MKKYSCSNCSYQSDLWSVKRHMLRKHKGCDTASINEASLTYNDNGVPNTVFIGEDGGHAPTTVFVGNNQSNLAPTTQYEVQPRSHYESTSPEIYPPNTVTMEEHNNIVEIANGWKTACENLQHSWNNIATTIAHTPECAPAFVPTPTLAPALAPAPSTDFVKNMQLEEYVYNEKDEKENLRICMNKYLIPRINILNRVRENDNMGEYPGHVIYCICEGLWNMRWKYKKLMCESTKCELKTHLESIKKYIRLLSMKKLSMKKKRLILSKPHVGRGVFTALASFVIPALISLITKK